MSDDSFDDTLLDDYKTGGPGILIDDSPKQGSIIKGLMFAIPLTLILELGVGLALDVQTNLVHRYIAYLLGLVPILVAAIYSKSILKMFFIGAPVLILTSFALPFFLPNIFSGLMTPFLTLLPIVDRANKLLTNLGQVDPSTQQLFNLVHTYGIALDFLLGIFVGVFAAIGLTALVKVFSGKLGVGSIFTFMFAMVFILLGVILFPYLLVITSGVSQFTMSFGMGGAVLGRGTTVSAGQNANLTLANQLFAEAEYWFQQAQDMLTGLQAMGIFKLMASSNPTLAVIVNNGVVLMDAAVKLAQGVAPALAGFTAISKGMGIAMSSLENSSNQASLLLSQTSSSNFDQGLQLVEQGFKNFTDAVPKIKEAINTIYNDVNRQDLVNALQSQGANVNDTLNLIFSALPLLNVTLDVFTNSKGTGLMDDADGLNSTAQRAPIIHLLLGMRDMSQVQSKIGETTSFQGTGSSFKDLIYNLNFVVNALDPSRNKAVDNLNNLQLESSAPSTIVNLKDQITGTVNFLRDAGNTTISIGRFGLVASPTLTAMNQTISFLTSASDFTTLSAPQYTNAINVFDGNATFNPGIVQNATRMQSRALNARSQIDIIANGTANNEYGYLNDPASSFVTQFRAFNLTKNADNFKYISTGLSSLLKSMRSLTVVDGYISLIDGNVTIITQEINNAQTAVGVPDLPQAQVHINNATNSVNSVKTDIVSANDTLQISKSHLYNSSSSFNKTKDMPQLAKTGAALGRIGVHMQNIQVGNGSQGLTGISQEITNIQNDVNSIQSLINANDNNASHYTPYFDDISTNLNAIQGNISYINSEFGAIQLDLADVNIAA